MPDCDSQVGGVGGTGVGSGSRTARKRHKAKITGAALTPSSLSPHYHLSQAPKPPIPFAMVAMDKIDKPSSHSAAHHLLVLPGSRIKVRSDPTRMHGRRAEHLQKQKMASPWLGIIYHTRTINLL